MYLFLFGEVGQRLDVSDGQVSQLGLARRAGIPRRHINDLETVCFGEPPGECVLTSAGTDDKYFHIG